MIDEEKIPESTYNELIELFGIEEAEKIIIKNKYNFQTISLIIIGERFIKYFGFDNFRFLLKKNIGLSIKSFFIILIVLGFVIYIFLL